VKRYCIWRLYRARRTYGHHDDSSCEDQWQLEVYLYALGLMKKHAWRSVIDIGCGSAYKLLTYLGDYETLGTELPGNVALLKERYPDRKWAVSDFSRRDLAPVDLIICSDVIEHLVDPDGLLEFVRYVPFKCMILSTPDRHLFYRPWHRGFWGPPKNEAHQREWTFREFNRYISMHFRVLDHRITNLRQATQMIVCGPGMSGGESKPG